MFAFLLVMRYMLATGYFPVNQSLIYPKTQIVDVSNPTKSCELNDGLAYESQSTGGMLGTTPVICGGHSKLANKCLLYGTSQKIMMNFKRYHHSSVGLNNSMLWIMGGLDDFGQPIDSTEFVTTEGAVNGPKLPEPIHGHCSVLFPGNGNVYLIGGTNDSDLGTLVGCFKNKLKSEGECINCIWVGLVLHYRRVPSSLTYNASLFVYYARLIYQPQP